MYVCIHNNTNNILLLKAGLGHTKSSNAQDVFRQIPGLIHVCMHVHSRVHACTCISLGSMLQPRSKASWLNYNTIGRKIFADMKFLLRLRLDSSHKNIMCENNNHCYTKKISSANYFANTLQWCIRGYFQPQKFPVLQ